MKMHERDTDKIKSALMGKIILKIASTTPDILFHGIVLCVNLWFLPQEAISLEIDK